MGQGSDSLSETNSAPDAREKRLIARFWKAIREEPARSIGRARRGLRDELKPCAYALAHFRQRLVTLERMIGAFDPAHVPLRLHRRERALHQIAPAEGVASAVEAQHRHR